ncbi:terminase [Enterobacter roggenkampii]|uniref:terminase n=1 Tax=Enterobacter roggenkampii TaxID=1812935 RepID=UPI0020059022|nr:terminase [Enterobacter roggenkampii]MCK7234460.1 terminase [Enterobacter roggenkampii]
MADKRTRSDSSAAAVQAMKNAAVDTIDPPSHAGLEKKAEPFWHDNIRSKALDSWTPADLLAAVELANNQLYITVLRKDLRKEERLRGEARDEGLIKDLRKQIVELQRTILAQRRDPPF